jgi:hypothetical protein
LPFKLLGRKAAPGDRLPAAPDSMHAAWGCSTSRLASTTCNGPRSGSWTRTRRCARAAHVHSFMRCLSLMRTISTSEKFSTTDRRPGLPLVKFLPRPMKPSR